MPEALIIVYVDIDDLNPSEYNPREISPEEEDQIKRSLDSFGFVENVIVNGSKARFNTIVSGHQRIRIAKELGYTQVPVHYKKLSLARERELNIRMNKNSGHFSEQLLKLDFANDELLDWGFSEKDLGIFDKIDYGAEWDGMPEYEQDDLMPHRQIIISFKSNEAVQEFAALIDQKLTDKTKSVWFPREEKNVTADKAYTDQNES